MKGLFLLPALFLVLGGVEPTTAQSNAKDNETLIKTAKILEGDPFAANAEKLRPWGADYALDNKEFGIIMCDGPFLETILDVDYQHNFELLAQYVMAMAAFKLQNKEVKDENVIQLAGVESTIRVYLAILKAKPTARFRRMDAIVRQQWDGYLKKTIEDSKCGSRKPEPIK